MLPLVDGYLAAEPTADAVGDVRLIADKAYSHPSTRTALRSRGIKHTIPERDDQVTRRKAKGSAGGRPPSFDGEIYKQRNTVERGFNRLKQWRGIATRYDKYALTFLGGVLLAAWIAASTHRNPEFGAPPSPRPWRRPPADSRSLGLAVGHRVESIAPPPADFGHAGGRPGQVTAPAPHRFRLSRV